MFFKDIERRRVMRRCAMKTPLFILALLVSCSLFADIPRIELTYQHNIAFPDTYALLEKQLEAISQVRDVRLNPETAVATLRWKPNEAFVYAPLDYATRSVGLYLQAIVLTVRGTVEEANLLYQFRSLGDNTLFTLLGPPDVGPGQVAARETTWGRKLTETQKKKLQEAKKQDLVITVTGELLAPTRYSQFYLVIDTISLPQSP
jgi:hypothetical protein